MSFFQKKLVIERIKKCIQCVLILLAGISSHAYAQASGYVVEINDPDYSEHLSQGVEYFEDAQGNLNLDQVLQLSQSGKFLSYSHDNFQEGYSGSVYWIKVGIRNQLSERTGQSESDRFFVSIRYPLLDDVRFYHIRDGYENDQYQTGDRFAFLQRFLKLNSFEYPISLKPGEKSQLFIRVQTTSSMSVPLYLETEKAFIENQFRLNSLDGIYLGIAIGLGIYNLLLWIGIRNKVYGFYGLLIFSLLLFNSTFMGFSYRIWPESVGFQQISVYLFSTLAAISMCLFGMEFLKTRSSLPKFHRYMEVAIVCYLAAIPLILTLPPAIAAMLNVAITISGLVILFIVAIRSLLEGYRPARYFLIGQGTVLVGVLFTVLTSLGLIPLHSLAPEIMKWSTAFELIFFSFALADLLNNERQLREIAQQETVRVQQESALKHKVMLQSQVKKVEKLDTLVDQRTEELEQANQRLQMLKKSDQLMGLHNRRYLKDVFSSEYQTAYRQNTPISLLMLDIDSFETVNDIYGHTFGEFCLTKVAELIQLQMKRPADIAFAYGVEGFIVLLPTTDANGARAVAERIRLAASQMVVSDGEHATSLTVSAGIASEVPEDRNGYERMLKQAEKISYQAKENGPNEIMVAEEEPMATLRCVGSD